MTLRILMVSDVYPPLIGGAERQIQLLSHGLTARGHSVSVATAWQVGLPEREDDAGVSVYRLKGLASRVPWFSINPKRRHHPPFPDPGSVWGLRQLIRRFRPDVVHTYGWITYSCAVALLGEKIPLLVSMREYGHTCALRTMVRHGVQPCDGPALIKCLECAPHIYGAPKGIAAVAGVFGGRMLLRRKISAIHSISRYMQMITWRDLYGGRERFLASGRSAPLDVIIPSFRESGEPAGDQAGLRQYLDQLPDQPFILFVGALRLVKGLEPLLAAYQRLTAPPPLVLIGVVAPDTPQSFPPNVTVLHDFPHQAVMAAWERSLFGVAPSLWPEPFGSVIHEAMSKSKAMIGTTPGGQTDMIIDGETGFLIPPNDVDALVGALRRLIDDPQLRERLGRAGRERSQLFTADVVIPRFEQLYRQLVSGPSSLHQFIQGACD